MSLLVWSLVMRRLPRAFCAGLIEARTLNRSGGAGRRCYPVLFARASLKRHRRSKSNSGRTRLPRAFCAGLIEASDSLSSNSRLCRLPRAFCAGLIEAGIRDGVPAGRGRYPVLFARASLKQVRCREFHSVFIGLPRAFCAGLIEAASSWDEEGNR